MEIKDIPDLFSNKVRLSIVAALISGEKSFKELKNIVVASDGNLGAQISKLEEGGYIECTKLFVDKKPRSIYRITELGMGVFKQYVKLLENVVNGEEGKDYC